MFGALLFVVALYGHTGPEMQKRREVYQETWYESITPTLVWLWLLPEFGDDELQLVARRLDAYTVYEGFDTDGFLRRSDPIIPGHYHLHEESGYRNVPMARFVSNLHYVNEPYQNLGPMHRDAMARAAERLYHQEGQNRRARLTLGYWIHRLVDDNDALTPLLLKIADDPNDEFQKLTLLYLGRTRTTLHREETLEVLFRYLTVEDDDVSCCAAIALAQLQVDTSEHLPFLLEKLKGPMLEDSRVYVGPVFENSSTAARDLHPRAAWHAAIEVAREAAIPHYWQVFNDPEIGDQPWAMQMLATFPREADAISVKALPFALNKEKEVSNELCRAAWEILEQIDLRDLASSERFSMLREAMASSSSKSVDDIIAWANGNTGEKQDELTILDWFFSQPDSRLNHGVIIRLNDKIAQDSF